MRNTIKTSLLASMTLTIMACGAEHPPTANQATVDRCSTPADFKPVAGIGMACSLGGNQYKVLLKDGSTRITHIDPASSTTVPPKP